MFSIEIHTFEVHNAFVRRFQRYLDIIFREVVKIAVDDLFYRFDDIAAQAVGVTPSQKTQGLRFPLFLLLGIVGKC